MTDFLAGPSQWSQIWNQLSTSEELRVEFFEAQCAYYGLHDQFYYEIVEEEVNYDIVK
jgi:hypothetical protein